MRASIIVWDSGRGCDEKEFGESVSSCVSCELRDGKEQFVEDCWFC